MGPSPAPLSALEGIFENLVSTLLALGGITLFILLELLNIKKEMEIQIEARLFKKMFAQKPQ